MEEVVNPICFETKKTTTFQILELQYKTWEESMIKIFFFHKIFQWLESVMQWLINSGWWNCTKNFSKNPIPRDLPSHWPFSPNSNLSYRLSVVCARLHLYIIKLTILCSCWGIDRWSCPDTIFSQRPRCNVRWNGEIKWTLEIKCTFLFAFLYAYKWCSLNNLLDSPRAILFNNSHTIAQRKGGTNHEVRVKILTKNTNIWKNCEQRCCMLT